MIQQATESNTIPTVAAQKSSYLAIAALALAALFASLAGVLLEKLFKTEGTNLWISNFQLSALSILPALSVILFDLRKQDAATFASFDIFAKSFMPWTAVLIQGLSGILVALTTKYAGCIAGSISGIASIAVTHLIELIMGQGSDALNEIYFLAGFSLVALGVAAYTLMGNPALSKDVASTSVGPVQLELGDSPTNDKYYSPLQEGPEEGEEEEEEGPDDSMSHIRAVSRTRGDIEKALPILTITDEEDKQ